MFVPYVNSTIFDMYVCDGDQETCGGLVENGIGWKTWVLDVGASCVQMLLSLLTRFIRTKDELIVKEKAEKKEDIDEILVLHEHVMQTLYVA